MDKFIELSEYSYGDDCGDNMIINGDNLHVLRGLIPLFLNKIKCIYIDPPYNTGKSFNFYEDNMAHDSWIEFMVSRLYEMRKLLSEDGSIWINIDDNSVHYLKVACDGVFGRNNFIGTIVWKKTYAKCNDVKYFSSENDFILLYARNKKIWRPNLLPRTEGMNNRYSNPDNDPRGPWSSVNIESKTPSEKQIYPIYTMDGTAHYPTAGRSWRFKKSTFDRMNAENRIWYGKNGNNKPRQKKFLSEVKNGVTPGTLWCDEDCGRNQEATLESRVIFGENMFSTPKPERLIERIIHMSTKPGDLVLDSFLGSGTTAAVAHKMGRRWIGIELGEHAITHCYPRLKAVVDGEQGGISKAVNWSGGGGFKFYELK